MAMAITDRSNSAPPPVPETRSTFHQRVLRIRNEFWARAGGDAASPPARVVFDLRAAAGDTGDELSTSEWTDIVNQVPLGAILRIETAVPLASGRFEAVLLQADRRGLAVEVVAEGLELEAVAACIYALGVRTVRVRLYGTEAVHNQVLGTPEAFYRTARGTLALKGLAGGLSGPRLVVEIPISAQNQRRIVDVTESALAMGADEVVIVHTPPNTLAMSTEARGDERPSGRSPARPSKSGGVDSAVVCRQIQSVKARWNHHTVTFFPHLSPEEIEVFYTGGPRYLPSPRCLVPWRSLTVGPRGTARFCKDRTLGSVREESLVEVYNSVAARAFRHKLREGLHLSCTHCLGRFENRWAR